MGTAANHRGHKMQLTTRCKLHKSFEPHSSQLQHFPACTASRPSQAQAGMPVPGRYNACNISYTMKQVHQTQRVPCPNSCSPCHCTTVPLIPSPKNQAPFLAGLSMYRVVPTHDVVVFTQHFMHRSVCLFLPGLSVPVLVRQYTMTPPQLMRQL